MVVTGATGGIGAAVVRAAADHGYRVTATGRDPDRLGRLCADLPDARPLVLDLADPAAIAGALPRLEALDALVHCAGIADVASVEETPPDHPRARPLCASSPTPSGPKRPPTASG
jgi:NADP-dependent 3-hydroxy acid dehydrogenase YdfG